MWIYIDNDNRVQGWNPNDMEGNTGWVFAAEQPPEDFMNYLFVDGVYVYDPLPEPEQPEPTPTLEQRVEVLEQKVDAELADQEEALNLLGVYV